jgi:hypothetical protein
MELRPDPSTGAGSRRAPEECADQDWAEDLCKLISTAAAAINVEDEHDDSAGHAAH